jgi:membrane-associated protease RseP (regulator of RpoE activity)
MNGRNLRSSFGFVFVGVCITLLMSQSARAQPLRSNSNEPGYLGLVADDRQEAGRGVRVMEVVNGGPAEKSGLQAGDLITAINGSVVHEMKDFATLVGPSSAGSKLAFRVERAGREQDFAVTLGTRPKAEERRFSEFGKIPDASSSTLPEPTTPSPIKPNPLTREQPRATGRPLLGVQSSPISEAARRRWNLPPGDLGAVVDSVVANSPAAASGLRTGDLIVAIDNRRVRDPEDLAQHIQAAGVGRKIEIAYISAGQIGRVEIVLIDSSVLNASPNSTISSHIPTASNYPTVPDGPPQPTQAIITAKPITEPPLILKKTTDDKNRVEMLEQRVRELDARVQELERMLKTQNAK